MDDFVRFQKRYDERLTRLESEMAESSKAIAVIQETLTERRRQADKIEDLLIEISANVNEIQAKISGYKMSAIALMKATAIITSVITAALAVLASVWSVLKDILKNPSDWDNF